MKTVLKWTGRLVLVLLVGFGLLALLGPREKVDLSAGFDASLLGDDIDDYFEREEAKFSDIVEGVQKRVVWAGDVGVKTPISVLYIHGFSASSEEIRPVPDKVAEALGANLVYTRLTGHGRSGAAMAQATASDWMRDTAEALAAARAVGESVVVIATSTGGTLVAAAALREKLAEADGELTAMTLALEAARKKAEETLTLLAAATRPHVRASSTTGVMKSAVDTIAWSASICHTAASSPVSVPTRSSSGCSDFRWRTTCANSPGASLQPQPAPWLNCVSLMRSRVSSSFTLASPLLSSVGRLDSTC